MHCARVCIGEHAWFLYVCMFYVNMCMCVRVHVCALCICACASVSMHCLCTRACMFLCAHVCACVCFCEHVLFVYKGMHMCTGMCACVCAVHRSVLCLSARVCEGVSGCPAGLGWAAACHTGASCASCPCVPTCGICLSPAQRRDCWVGALGVGVHPEWRGRWQPGPAPRLRNRCGSEALPDLGPQGASKLFPKSRL